MFVIVFILSLRRRIFMRDFKKFVYIVITISFIMVIGPILVSIIRPSLCTAQTIISEYTLAVTVVLAIAALAGGGFFILTYYLKREIEQQRGEIERIFKETGQRKEDIEKWHKEISAKRDKLMEILQVLPTPNLFVGLSLAKEIRKRRGKISSIDDCLDNLAQVFEENAFLGVQAVRLFTATERKDVEAAAMALFHRMPDGKKLIETDLLQLSEGEAAEMPLPWGPRSGNPRNVVPTK